MTNTSVFMFLTRSCNLACSHCYVSAEPQLKEHMSLDVFRSIVDFLLVRGINDLRLTGGEPTVHPEFGMMLDLLNSKKIAPRLITNGVNLMQMRSPQSVLDRVSRCWISAYGISAQQHRAIGGERSRPLEDILGFAGQQAATGHWVGVSALLTEVSLNDLKAFFALAQEYGVRYLRFLFGEPSGRAVPSHVAFTCGASARDQAITVVDYLRHSVTNDAFKFLSINNPFDFNSTQELGCTSCMLGARRMWSISPEGNIYSCCFNIYDPAHFVTNALSDDGVDALNNNNMVNVYAPRCKGLNASFWGTNSGAVTCPISALTLSCQNDSQWGASPQC
jgi:MoaA/NifB/PqqE/SkfB family radical SAM enzyme